MLITTGYNFEGYDIVEWIVIAIISDIYNTREYMYTIPYWR